MSLTINHNPMAMNAQRNLESHYGDLATSTRRLSSGLRVDTAADDAAGLAVRELMRADIAAMNQGVRNANDGISAIQTADGSLEVIDNKLIRMKELAEQAATGTYTADQREVIDGEYQQMKEEINRIARQTEFNQTKLIDGSLTGDDAMKVHFGPRDNFGEDYYYVDMGDATARGLNIDNSYLRFTTEAPVEKAHEIISHVENEILGGDYDNDEIQGHLEDVYRHMEYAEEELNKAYATLDGDERDQVDDIRDQLSTAMEEVSGAISTLNDGESLSSDEITDIESAKLKLDAMIDGGRVDFSDQSDSLSGGQTIGVVIGDKEITYEVPDNVSGSVVIQGLVDAINDEDGYAAEVDPNNDEQFFITQGAGDDEITGFAASGALGDDDLTVDTSVDQQVTLDIDSGGGDWTPIENTTYSLDIDGQTVEYVATENDNSAEDIAEGLANAITRETDFNASESGSNIIILDPDDVLENETAENYNLTGWKLHDDINLDEIPSENLNTGAVDANMSRHIRTEYAQQALETIDAAIEEKDKIRADLGAYQNRLDNTVSNLQIQAENLQAAESRISDVDVAHEMTQFTRNQVLSQGATAMLAQANTLPQMAMQLMG